MVSGATLAVTPAESLLQRSVGLIGRKHLGDDEGMLFEHCSSIHTFFMRIPIDVLFLDADRRIIRAVPNVAPWRPFVGYSKASSVVELAAGSIERLHLHIGDAVELSATR
ncbi:MAG TPA: DUF192 domain-containing protein [Candidatus Tyrphobacter sp.]